MAKVTDPDLLAQLGGGAARAATSPATQTKAEPEVKKPTPPAKKSMMDTVFPRGTPAWMQGGAATEADIVSDPSNPFSYIREDQKTEQGAVGKAISKGVQNTMRVGAGLTQGAVVDPLRAVAQMIPLEMANEFARAGGEEYEKFRKGMGGEGFDASRLVGSVVSPAGIKGAQLLSKWAPVAKMGAVGQGATIGGAQSLITPVEDLAPDATYGDIIGSKLGQAGMGALTGGALGKLLSPSQKLTQSTNRELGLPAGRATFNKELSDAENYARLHPDAYRTLGMTGGLKGKAFSKFEQMLESLPLTGSLVKQRRGEALEDWNLGQMNRALGMIDEKLPKGAHAGREMFDQAGDILSKRYDKLLDKVQLKNTDKLNENIIGKIDDAGNYQAGIVSEQYNALSDQGKTLFDRAYKTLFVDKARKAPDGSAIPMTGQQFKNMEEALKKKIKNFSSSSDGEQREVAEMLNDTLVHLKGNLEGFGKNGVKASEELGQLNKSYAALKAMENASVASGASRGIFTPTQLMNKITGPGYKSQVAKGHGLMQDEIELAQRMFGDTLPNSGTADRLLGAGALGVLGAGGFGGALASPAAIPLGLGAYMYSKTGQAINRKVGQGLDAAKGFMQTAPGLKYFGAPAARNYQQVIGASQRANFGEPQEEHRRGGLMQAWS